MLHPPSRQQPFTEHRQPTRTPMEGSVSPPYTHSQASPPRSPSPPPTEGSVSPPSTHSQAPPPPMGAVKESEDVIQQQLTFSFVGESAIDQSGVSRDAYSSFWDAFYERRTSGTNTVVPCVTVQYCREEWLAVGHILVKGYKDHSIFPIRLNLTFLTVMLPGKKAVSEDFLLSSLYSYLSEDVKDLLTRAGNNDLEDDDESELVQFLADSGWTSTIPNYVNKTGFDKCLLQIRHKILIQTSKYPLVCLADVTRKHMGHNFSDVESLKTLVKDLTPTTRKVLKIFPGRLNSAREQNAFDLLKKYVRGLGRDMLPKFLKFCTGSSVMSVTSIDVTFNSISGLQRRPVAITCGPVLEISVMYTDIAGIRYEFNSVLKGGTEGLLFTIS
ncbi:hypothetical protein HOLleu_10520 [Holothuria leucospilota]|uniref:Uncharacterized protein n=1 Tax=Holothuria leucospilota TaxID=206669 RepID=A0A9Q1HEX6_HOLLE|nr:hypothetical protein HOLleu_10520 [Holothuria leucospilota]